jgi:hypothetical protein
MDDNTFFLRCWALIAVVLITMVTSVTMYNIYTTKQITKVIQAGVNPLDAYCAYSMSSTNCQLRATK